MLGAKSFYLHLMNSELCGNLAGHNILITRAKDAYFKHGAICKISTDDYYRKIKKTRYSEPGGISDSVRQLLLSHDPHDRYL